MAKNPNDKYYTQESEVKKVMEILLKFIPKESITEIIEPAAGDGAFIEEIKKLGIPYKFYDLIPEHPEIEQKDFKDLMKEMEYKKGRVFVGNPPFGNASSLFKRFRNGAMEKGDWAVYIGPASHWNMKWGLKGMELVYSEHLGGVEYRGLENKKVNTCVNVYRRISGNIVDRRMEMLERDFEIRIIKHYGDGTYRESNWNEFDYYLIGYGPNIGKIETIPENSSSWGIKILNEKLINKSIEFFETFYKKNENEIKNGCVKSPNIRIDFLKQKMIEHFYPTREEMLERDFEIKTLYYNEGEGADFYLRGMECGGIGVFERKNNIRIGECSLEKQKYIPSIAIKVLNKNMFEKAKQFFEVFNKNYGEDVIKVNAGYPRLQPTFVKQKMIEHFYPTREEMLERDFEIKNILKYSYGKWGRNGNEVPPGNNYDFYLDLYPSGVLLLNMDDVKCGTFLAIKIKNINLKEKTEIFLSNFKERFKDHIDKIKGEYPCLNIPFIKQKMIEEFYPDVPEYFDTFETIENRLDKDVKIWGENIHHDRVNKEPADFYIASFKSGLEIGRLDLFRKEDLNICIKVLNTSKYDIVKEFCEDFYINYKDELEKTSCGPLGLTQDFFKEKMAEYIYSNNLEEYKKTLNKERALSLFEGRLDKIEFSKKEIPIKAKVVSLF